MTDPRLAKLASVLLRYSVPVREGGLLHVITTPIAALGEAYFDGELFYKDGKFLI